MKNSKIMSLLMVMVLVVLAALTCCSSEGSEKVEGGEDANVSWKDRDPEEIKGEITFISQRTDIVDTVFPEY